MRIDQDKMSIGAFTDKSHLPTSEEIQAMLGSQWEAWLEFNQFVINSYACTGEFKFYGKNYGWAVRYRKTGKALLSVYPAQAGFTIQIILSEGEIVQARQNGLEQVGLRAIDAANPYPEGRWLFIPIKSDRDLQDIKMMLAIKTSRMKIKNQSL